MVKKKKVGFKKSVRWREGSWKEERVIVQSVIDPSGEALPSHPSPRVLGKMRQKTPEK